MWTEGEGDFWESAKREFHWRAGPEGQAARDRPPLSVARDVSVSASGSRRASMRRSQQRSRSRSRAQSAQAETRPRSRQHSRSARPGETGTTLTKGAGWPWEGGRRVPTVRPPTPERFDAYVSVRSGADLGNKANLNSPEQRMLEQVRTFDLSLADLNPPSSGHFFVPKS